MRQQEVENPENPMPTPCVLFKEVTGVMLPLWIFAALLARGTPRNPPLTAAAIMARVAANQDRSNRQRPHYVYHQRIRVAARTTNGKLKCQETLDYLVIPSSESTKKELQGLKGRYWHKGRYVDFHHKLHGNQESVDCDVVDSLGEDFTSERSKDGIAKDLFPLTTQQQKKYTFELIGKETLQEREVYRVSFRPKDKKEFDWTGEADIDMNDFQPVDVFTKLSRRIPLPIRTLLLSLPDLGFNVQYQRQPDGVWFPTSFGTEFRLKLLMFYRREYTVSLENSAFRRTHVTSKMRYAGLAEAQRP
jgi:hypothetical protein